MNLADEIFCASCPMDCSCVECHGTLGLRGAVCGQVRQLNRAVTSITAESRALPIVVLSRNSSRAGFRGVRVMRSAFPLEIPSPIDTKPPPTPPVQDLLWPGQRNQPVFPIVSSDIRLGSGRGGMGSSALPMSKKVLQASKKVASGGGIAQQHALLVRALKIWMRIVER